MILHLFKDYFAVYHFHCFQTAGVVVKFMQEVVLNVR